MLSTEDEWTTEEEIQVGRLAENGVKSRKKLFVYKSYQNDSG